MTPNFALSLSFDGIRLMHRTMGGWNLIGEVALDAPNLSAELANLRRTALALDPAGLRTKLLLPNDQIKYLSIDTTQTTLEDIHGILDGATPYKIDELVIDFDRCGGRTHIAAVARETLKEAETFAAQYKFAPVAFAAVAEPFTFSTEVFFGPTSMAKDLLGDDVKVKRDTEAVKIIGRTTMPTPSPMGDAMPLTLQAAPEPEIAPEQASDSKPQTPDPMAEPVLTFGRNRAPAPRSDTATLNVEKETSQQAPKSGSTPAAKGTKTPSLPQIDEPVFTSRLTILAADRVLSSPEDAAVAVQSISVPTDDDAQAPLFTRRAPTPPLAVTTGDSGNAELHLAEPDAPAVPRPVIMADVGPATTAPPIETPKAMERVTAQAIPAPGSVMATPAPAKPQEPFTSTTQVGGKPRYLALKLTAALLVFFALVAIWASFLSEDGVSGWFTPDAADPVDVPVVAALPDPAPAATGIVSDEDVANVTAAIAPEGTDIPERTAPPVPIVTTGRGRVLSPAEADRIYAATGVWQRAPRLPTQPQPQVLEKLQIIAPPTEVTTVQRPQILAVADDMPDLPLLPQPDPPPFGAELPRDADGFILASENGTVMPHGVLVYARSPNITPPLRPTPAITEPEPIPTPETQSADSSADAPPPEEGLVVITGAPPVQPPLRPRDTEIVPDPIIADDSAEATNQEDVLPPGAVSIAAFRPAVRPDGLTPEPPAEPFADPALAGLRPSLRPEGLAPVLPDAPDVADAVAEALAEDSPDISSVIATIAAAAPPSPFINPTDRAIAASPRPDPRPNNFSRVVASAQQLQQRQETSANARRTSAAVAATPVASASVAPTGAIPGSVAQAATVADVISLRNVNLIGVYGRPSDRRALIRLANGRYVKVEVGSSFEGGQVTAISDNALNYVVRGQTYYLALPAS